MNFFGFGPAANISVVFDGEEQREKHVIQDELPAGGKTDTYPIYEGHEDVTGTVSVEVTKPLTHIGIKVELIGEIMFNYSNSSYEFTSLVRELAPPGIINGRENFKFKLAEIPKRDESYFGVNARLRYYVKVTITKSYGGNVEKEREFWVVNKSLQPDLNSSIKMEVGIEQCLHIEFEYNKSKYHLEDIIIGKIYFLLVRIKIKHMELAIIKRETVGTGDEATTDSTTVMKYEVMDGYPVKEECVPIRLFLKACEDMTPTYKSVHNKFSVRYYLNLVLVDKDDRRYFKQQEIVLWRKA